MHRGTFHPEAEEEFLAAADFYETRQPGLGTAFIEAVEATVQRAATEPRTGSPRGAQLRWLFVDRFPYYVLYAGESAPIHVVAVAHFRRRPGYWRHRLGGVLPGS